MYKPTPREETAARLIRWLLIGCLLSPLLTFCATARRTYPGERATPHRILTARK